MSNFFGHQMVIGCSQGVENKRREYSGNEKKLKKKLLLSSTTSYFADITSRASCLQEHPQNQVFHAGAPRKKRPHDKGMDEDGVLGGRRLADTEIQEVFLHSDIPCGSSSVEEVTIRGEKRQLATYKDERGHFPQGIRTARVNLER